MPLNWLWAGLFGYQLQLSHGNRVGWISCGLSRFWSVWSVAVAASCQCCSACLFPCFCSTANGRKCSGFLDLSFQISRYSTLIWRLQRSWTLRSVLLCKRALCRCFHQFLALPGNENKNWTRWIDFGDVAIGTAAPFYIYHRDKLNSYVFPLILEQLTEWQPGGPGMMPWPCPFELQICIHRARRLLRSRRSHAMQRGHKDVS